MALKRRFRTKFIAVTGVGILIGLIANAWVASSSLKTLGNDSTQEIEKGLGAVSQEYLTNYIEDASARINLMFRQALADTKVLADITQGLLDHGDALDPLDRMLPNLAPFRHEMSYNPDGPWLQSEPGGPSVVSLWGSALEADGGIPGRTLPYIQRGALPDAVMPAIEQNGAEKLQVYYVSPDEASVARMSPYTDIAGYLDKTDTTSDKAHYRVPFFAHYFPGLVTAWASWPEEDPAKLAEYGDATFKSELRQLTLTPVYDDAAGGGKVVTIFHPLWTVDRKRFNGAVGVDLPLDQIIEDVQTVALGQTGFAFLSQSNGNILALNDDGVDVLHLADDRGPAGSGQSLAMQEQWFKESRDPAVAALQLPTDEQVHLEELTIDDKSYVLVMKRMGQFNQWDPPEPPFVRDESWTLGFIVPTEEIYSSLIASRRAIERSTDTIRTNQVIVMLVTLLLVLIAVYIVAERMTTDLVALSDAASRIKEKDYDVRVEVTTEDEVGHLGTVFNEMASEIQSYTQNLESLVAQRTVDLQEANEEIKALNEKLKEENVRLAAEIDVARRLQMMVLPHPDELQEIDDLDIDGYMKPADEVGGDYYDVLKGPNGVMFGMGDVTGHGLESGVLMLMVQTAVRALLNSGESDPTRFLDLVNRTVFLNKQRMDVDRNLSLCLLEYRDGKLVVTGQHEEIIVVRADGKVELLDTTPLGFPIGLDLDVLYLFSSRDIALQPGDTVILYTDGITEAENRDGKYYGTDRLCETVAGVHTRSAKEIREAVVADIMSYIGDTEVFDDITLLVIKKT